MTGKLVFLCLMFALMSGCTFHNKSHHKAGHYKIGSSYKVYGITYHPKNYGSYEEVGIASWYGIEDHDKPTANGEIFDRHSVSAAHKTLPLPCFVLVTNLKNGKKLVVRVNDRGPFFQDRIIDLSEEAARILDFHEEGLTRVKIKYLKKKSEQLVKKNPHYKKQYERAIQERHPKKTTTESKGYIASFKNAHAAKLTASKLRSQGMKNVRLLFKDNQYSVKVS
ncbi:septal ring lytic transglycosylase RlpA family protein [Wolbachia endosymbiont of Folsomia candida]|uniref:septal ring lytic transglycosylase RlpA family protein n=1 Tax=Wolbachia endosymbiont of Folsomia candida TaxID=169402 RepID=UPI000B07A7ED|nr:septal ring lytic transglycosylase RlpA family protein [Wolbachia endosymbiont of Folsomia candida]APR98477.1 septal ring lytic transglycosylase RlpA family lipoprotein [Wolbachia endosymbiont of Folsomia candida]